MNKESSIGIGVVIILVSLIGYVGGVHGLISLGIMFAFGMLALFLYSRKSKIAKAGAILVFPEILTKFLMPKRTKRAIDELNEKENKT
jgi:TctA family transporter